MSSDAADVIPTAQAPDGVTDGTVPASVMETAPADEGNDACADFESELLGALGEEIGGEQSFGETIIMKPL